MLFRTGTQVVSKTGKGGGSGPESTGGNSKRQLDAPVPLAPTSQLTENPGDQSSGQWVDKVSLFSLTLTRTYLLLTFAWFLLPTFKVFFSSFFGGSTSDYAATSDTYSYFKDISLHAGTSASTLPGLDATPGSDVIAKTNGSSQIKPLPAFSLVILIAISLLLLS